MDRTLPWRIAGGAIIFAALAYIDWRRRRRDATRWREYAFLLFTVLCAMAYGVANDLITSRMSWEYFYYGKGLAEVLPASPVPHPRLDWEAAKVGMKATWSAGLIIGVALLRANNPSPTRVRLPYRSLARSLAVVFAITVLAAALGGVAGYFGAFVHFSQDFLELQKDHAWRPQHFMAVYGIHLGGYVGALIGTAVAAVVVRRRRPRLSAAAVARP